MHFAERHTNCNQKTIIVESLNMLLNKYGPSDSLLNFKYPKQSKKVNFGQTNVIFEVIFQEVIHMKNPAYVPLKTGIFGHKHCHNRGQEVIHMKNRPRLR